ncbi:hypothetical protein AHMF7605_11935 [Adhaeribacter arboris]|uniref:Uncharacterized protein n=1 Tax=Adhaeribacter arboris TaxID=2072846 RepID=A0A2T2YF89_9BACT|nr:hypothetical protein [Adhaeribacter arboris]PSR54181.1 hypothetical protein AHMF7605_11935 [Adhaeribacter arboris]
MEFQLEKHVKVVCDLQIGQQVTVSGWGRQLDGKTHTIQGLKLNYGGCESGVMVKLNNYPNWIDSNWIDKY